MKKDSLVADSVMITLPPIRLTLWLAKVFDAKRASGQRVPSEFDRWLTRVNAIRENTITELSVLTQDELVAIKTYLEGMTNDQR